MELPQDLTCLIDGDIIRYEIGYAAETGWKARTSRDEMPPFDYVAGLLHERLDNIKAMCNSSVPHRLFLTEGKTFRYELAKKKEYKATRKSDKPKHFANLTAYLKSLPETEVITGVEADDAMSVSQVRGNTSTIICSRDKDLRQVPGWGYGWELGRQPSFGPEYITPHGTLTFDNGKIKGTGLRWFYTQLIVGDSVDNIAGLPGMGPVKTWKLLQDLEPVEMLDAVKEAYEKVYPDDWEVQLTEMGRLCWMTRDMDLLGNPVLWEIGMEQ